MNVVPAACFLIWVVDGVRIGIVEDSDEDYALLKRVFKGHAAISRWADAETALADFADEAVFHDLSTLLVDLNLPGIDGFELIERVRAMPGGEAPLVCVLSSSGRPADMRRAEAAGADGYLVKPADVAGLKALPAKIAALASKR